MHDWSDTRCQTILSNIVAVMDKEYSRLLIDDFVLPDTGVDSHAASMDVLMMLCASGIERTVCQWEALLNSVNLEIVEIHSTRMRCEAVIETRKRA